MADVSVGAGVARQGVNNPDAEAGRAKTQTQRQVSSSMESSGHGTHGSPELKGGEVHGDAGFVTTSGGGDTRRGTTAGDGEAAGSRSPRGEFEVEGFAAHAEKKKKNEWDIGVFVLSGLSSGVGKTTLACGLIRALRKRGIAVLPFKVGPGFEDSNRLAMAAASASASSSGEIEGGAHGGTCLNLDDWLLGGRDACIRSFQNAIKSKIEEEEAKGSSGQSSAAADVNYAGPGLQKRRLLVIVEGQDGALFDDHEGSESDESDACDEDGSDSSCGLLAGASSTAEVAKWLGAPVVMVVDSQSERAERHGGSSAKSVAAQLRGFQIFDPEVHVEAVILNRAGEGSASVSGRGSSRLRPSHSMKKLSGAIRKTFIILGQVPLINLARKANDNKGELEILGEEIGACFDLDFLANIGMQASAPGIRDIIDRLSDCSNQALPRVPSGGITNRVKIAVAWDEAFHSYYFDNLAMMKENGADLVYFSPLRDSNLPEDVKAVYLGGGCLSEQSARILGENKAMRFSLLAFAMSGGVVYAECGGLMYLSASTESREGVVDAMIGFFPFRTRRTKRANRGYVTVTTTKDSGLFPVGEKVRGYIHHSTEIIEERVINQFRAAHSRGLGGLSRDRDSVAIGPPSIGRCSSYAEVYHADAAGTHSTAGSSLVGNEGYKGDNVLASFIHLHWRSNPAFAGQFVDYCSKINLEDLSGSMQEYLKRTDQVKSETRTQMDQMFKASLSNRVGPRGRHHEVDTPLSSNDDSLVKTWSYSDSQWKGIAPHNISEQHKRIGLQLKSSTVDAITQQASHNRSSSHGELSQFNTLISNPDQLHRAYSYFDLNHEFMYVPQEEAICCLCPQATEMVCALGLGSRLVAVTDQCDYPPRIQLGRRVVCETRKAKAGVLGSSASSASLAADGAEENGNNSINGGSNRGSPSGKGEHSGSGSGGGGGIRETWLKKETPATVIDVSWLSGTRPGTIITDECSAGMSTSSINLAMGGAGAGAGGHDSPHPGIVMDALSQAGLADKNTRMPIGCAILHLRTNIFSDVFEHLLEIGSSAGVYEEAVQVVRELRLRLRSVVSRVAKSKHRPRVISFEGISPLVIRGRWLPEMKQLAGGQDPLQEPGNITQRVNWQKVRNADPEVLILSPCSSCIAKTLRDVSMLASMPGWWSISAVHRGEVYIVDPALFCRPGPRLVDGVELLAHLLHPDIVERPEAASKVLKLSLMNGQRCNPKNLYNYFQDYKPASI